MKHGGTSRGEDWFISSVLFFTEVIITSLWWMLTFYCSEKWQSERFAFKLSTSSFFAPILPVCMYVERAGERHVDMLVIQANKGTEERAIATALTPRGPQLSKVSDLHLWEIAPENKKGGSGWGEKGRYRSDACSNKLMSGSAYKEQCCLGNAGSQSLVRDIGILLNQNIWGKFGTLWFYYILSFQVKLLLILKRDHSQITRLIYLIYF